MRPEIGSQPIPGYQITQFLGAGAFSQVWEARNQSHSVALKFIDSRTVSPSMIASEVRILRCLTELKHPNIIQLLGVHAVGKYLILIMECADGSLADLHTVYREETGENVPAEHALELLEEAAEGLDFLAATRLSCSSRPTGLQHCDIKPSNLLLQGDRLKIGDFGLAAVAGATTHHGGGWRGTPPYAAPELYRGQPTLGTDQFALAVCFCELVMGTRPFWKDQLLDSQPRDCPVDLTKLREHEFPVLARALHRYPSSRWPSCRVFIQELRKAVRAGRNSQWVRICPRSAAPAMRQSGVRRAVKVSDPPTGSQR